MIAREKSEGSTRTASAASHISFLSSHPGFMLRAALIWSRCWLFLLLVELVAG